VQIQRSGGTGNTWGSTKYVWDGVNDYSGCSDYPNGVANNETDPTVTVAIPAPELPGNYTLQITPNSADYSCTGTDRPTSNAFPVVASAVQPNNDLQQACGIDLILVLDESFSIYQSNAVGDVRAAAKAFLDGIVNTGSEVAIVEFSTNASTVFSFQVVNDTNLAEMKKYIDDQTNVSGNTYDPQTVVGYTNWDAALSQVDALNDAHFAPLVVYLTDGDPTTSGDGSITCRRRLKQHVQPGPPEGDLRQRCLYGWHSRSLYYRCHPRCRL
jgi:hypothetical protein